MASGKLTQIQVEQLKRECLAFMETNLMNVRCIASLIRLSDVLELPELHKFAMFFASSHMNQVIDYEYFGRFDMVLLEILLRRTDIVISSEFKLVRAIVEQRPPEDHRTLVPLIRFPLVPPYQLLKIEKMEFGSGTKICGLLLEAYKYHSLPKDLQAQCFKDNIQVVRRNYCDFIWYP